MAKLATFYDHMKDIERQDGIALFDAMKLTKGLGVDYLEISSGNIIGREDEVGHELAGSGLEISSIPVFFQFDTDTDVKKQAEPALEAASYLSADKILVIPGFFDETDDAARREQKTLQMERCINELGELAARFHVSLLMEDFDSALSPCSTAQGLLRFFDRCPCLSCAFDTGNFRIMGEDPLQAYSLLKSHITHVHLKDRAYRQANGETPKMTADGTAIYPAPVGSGDLPLQDIVGLLRRDGYDGIYTIEHYESARTLDYLKQSVTWVREQLS